MRLVLYTGKGGVGKTTTAAATALRAAELGRRTLLLSADSAHSLGDVLGCRLGPEPRAVAPRLQAFELDARAEISRHWGRIRDFLVALFTHHGIDGVVAEELALLPGAEELTALLALEACAASRAFDFAVVDCAPTDSTLRLVTLPDVARRSLRLLLPLGRALAGVATPLARRVLALPLPGADVFREADELVSRKLGALQRRLTRSSTSVRIVVTPERMAIDEGRRACADLSLFGIPCDAVVMNRLLPAVAGGEAFFREWARVQAERRREVAERFAPLPLLEAPLQDDEVTGCERLAAHGRQLFARVDPDALLCRPPRIRFEREGEAVVACVPLPGVEPAGLDVAKVGDELTITTGARRRALLLPRRVALLALAGARLQGDTLRVRFAPERAEAG